jgi:sodium-dependent dicarboxylate transporter 2/3/5
MSEKSDRSSRMSISRLCFIGASLLLIFFFKFIPAPEGLPQTGVQVLGIFLGMLLLWLTVSVTWASILCLLAIMLLPGMGVEPVFSRAFGNWLFPFLICTFAITHTLSKTQFVRRVVLFLISRKFAQKNPWNFIISLFLSVCLLGLFTEPTVLFVMFLPVVENIFRELGLKKGEKPTKLIMLGLILTCSISSAMTPIAHTFPLVAIAFFERDTGISIDYVSYSIFGIVIGVVILAAMMLIFKFILKPDLSMIRNLNIARLASELTPMDRKEKVTLGVFGIVILLWLLPSMVKTIFPELSNMLSSFSNALPPMAGLVVLAIVTSEGKPLLDFVDSMKNGVPWAGVFMACSILALGSIMTMEEVGLISYLTAMLSPLTQNLSSWLFLLLIVAWAILQTNFSSNMVTLTVVYTVAMPLAIAGGHGNPAITACLLGASASLAFASPAATAHVSIAVGTPWISVSELLRYGLLMTIASMVVILIVGVPLLGLIFPAP